VPSVFCVGAVQDRVTLAVPGVGGGAGGVIGLGVGVGVEMGRGNPIGIVGSDDPGRDVETGAGEVTGRGEEPGGVEVVGAGTGRAIGIGTRRALPAEPSEPAPCAIPVPVESATRVEAGVPDEPSLPPHPARQAAAVIRIEYPYDDEREDGMATPGPGTCVGVSRSGEAEGQELHDTPNEPGVRCHEAAARSRQPRCRRPVPLDRRLCVPTFR
jgi:hypothetical protein